MKRRSPSGLTNNEVYAAGGRDMPTALLKERIGSLEPFKPGRLNRSH